MLRKPIFHAFLWTAILIVGISLPGRTAHHLTVFAPDKFLHMGGFVILGILWLRVYPDAFTRILAYGALFGILTEVYQHVMPISRSFDPFDIVSDFVGLFIGVFTFRSFLAFRKSREAEQL